MKLILEDPSFGKVTWEVPDDLSTIIDKPEQTLKGYVEEMNPVGRNIAEHFAGKLKGVVIGVIQRQISTFFTLLTTAHRQAPTANPPRKYSDIIDRGIIWTATEMKKTTAK